MALQGNLRDFAVSEILQLLGTQKKTGCLGLDHDGVRASLYVQDGRIVAARDPGMAADDPLLLFLRRVRGLSEEQERGLATIHRETKRDLEDLLLNGRYLDADSLTSFLERYILEALLMLSRWESGNYRFDPHARWPNAILVRMSMEGALIEAARRIDEQKRFQSVFKDPYQLLGVRDLPDPDESLSDEERELFGIIDGQHTVSEVIENAPLTEFETLEALHRMLEANWIEVVGRRDPGRLHLAPATPRAVSESKPKPRLLRELIAGITALALFAGLILGGRALVATTSASPPDDVFLAAQVTNVRSMIELYHRENGAYPANLQRLVEDAWLSPQQIKIPHRELVYRPLNGGQDYRLDLVDAR